MSLKHKYALNLPKEKKQKHSLTEFHVGLSNIFSFAGRIKRSDICVSQFPTLVKKNAGTEELKTSYLGNTNEEICNSD